MGDDWKDPSPLFRDVYDWAARVRLPRGLRSDAEATNRQIDDHLYVALGVSVHTVNSLISSPTRVRLELGRPITVPDGRGPTSDTRRVATPAVPRRASS